MTQPPPIPPAPPPPPDDRQPGFLERLARQSSGVGRPNDPAQPQPGDDDLSERRRLWRLAGLGIQFAGTVFLLGFLGRRLDLHYGWHNVATITGLSIAIVGSLYLLIKQALSANK